MFVICAQCPYMVKLGSICTKCGTVASRTTVDVGGVEFKVDWDKWNKAHDPKIIEDLEEKLHRETVDRKWAQAKWLRAWRRANAYRAEASSAKARIADACADYMKEREAKEDLIEELKSAKHYLEQIRGNPKDEGIAESASQIVLDNFEAALKRHTT